MEPQQIKAIKDTFWTHGIWFNGLTYALRSTLDKELKLELGRWWGRVPTGCYELDHCGLSPWWAAALLFVATGLPTAVFQSRVATRRARC